MFLPVPMYPRTPVPPSPMLPPSPPPPPPPLELSVPPPPPSPPLLPLTSRLLFLSPASLHRVLTIAWMLSQSKGRPEELVRWRRQRLALGGGSASGWHGLVGYVRYGRVDFVGCRRGDELAEGEPWETREATRARPRGGGGGTAEGGLRGLGGGGGFCLLVWLDCCIALGVMYGKAGCW